MGFEFQRVYGLPLTAKDAFASATSHFLGQVHECDKTWADVEVSMAKAKGGGYDTLCFSVASIDSLHLYPAILLALRNNHRVVIQFTSSQLLHADFSKILELRVWVESRGLDLIWNWIEDLGRALTLEESQILESRLENWSIDYATAVGTRIHNPVQAAKNLRTFHKTASIFFHFPVSTGRAEISLSSVQAYNFVQELKFHFGDVKAVPAAELFDPRVIRTEGFEPDVSPEYFCSIENSEPIVSVVIPTYNNKIYVSNVLRHLQFQDLDPKSFEVILVDDGSSDGTREAFFDFAKNFQDRFNFKYLYFPRSANRSMGDLNFRAGVARNLGVRHSEGSLLLFLDSDILLPSNYLSDLIELHKKFDVVQGARLELIETRSSGATLYSEIEPNTDTYVVDQGYWINFINSPDWNQIVGGWKYTCTHSLSMRSDQFKEMGWFRKVFVGYGFEDSDLGYRLWKSGSKFTVNPKKVFHLYHANKRSEFANSLALKLELLKNTAKIFYMNTLDDDVFERCKFLFAPSPIGDWMGDRKAKQVWAKALDSAKSERSKLRVIEKIREPVAVVPAGDLKSFQIPSAFRWIFALLLTLGAPIELSYQNPAHSWFWAPIKFLKKFLLNPFTATRDSWLLNNRAAYYLGFHWREASAGSRAIGAQLIGFIVKTFQLWRLKPYIDRFLSKSREAYQSLIQNRIIYYFKFHWQAAGAISQNRLLRSGAFVWRASHFWRLQPIFGKLRSTIDQFRLSGERGFFALRRGLLFLIRPLIENRVTHYFGYHWRDSLEESQNGSSPVIWNFIVRAGHLWRIEPHWDKLQRALTQNRLSYYFKFHWRDAGAYTLTNRERVISFVVRTAQLWRLHPYVGWLHILFLKIWWSGKNALRVLKHPLFNNRVVYYLDYQLHKPRVFAPSAPRIGFFFNHRLGFYLHFHWCAAGRIATGKREHLRLFVVQSLHLWRLQPLLTQSLHLWASAIGSLWRLRMPYWTIKTHYWNFMRDYYWPIRSELLQAKALLARAKWPLSWPLRKIYYTLRFQLNDLHRIYRKTEITIFLRRVRRFGSSVALEAHFSWLEDLELIALTLQGFFLEKVNGPNGGRLSLNASSDSMVDELEEPRL